MKTSRSQNSIADVMVVGGGIVGLSTARALLRSHPGLKLRILEKEAAVGQGQTGHNSGVIHSGIYYKPGSLKARLCVEGRRALVDFCHDKAIPWIRCGKLVVATSVKELPHLEELHRRGMANGVEDLRMIDAPGITLIEPAARGIQALHVGCAGIVDFEQVALALGEEIAGMGAEVISGARVVDIHERGDHLVIRTAGGGIHRAGHLINCGGLFCDRIAAMLEKDVDVRILPFRGEYYQLHPACRSLVRSLIYPVPDPDLPFLGVHFTTTVSGEVEAGPNAVLALSREGYRWLDIDPGEILGMLVQPRFWKMASRQWKAGLAEMHRSMSKAVFVRDLQKLVPHIQGKDLVRGGAGVRAQAVDRSGKLLDDFRILEGHRALHVLNAPSPAATASLSIGEYLAEKAAGSFGLQ